MNFFVTCYIQCKCYSKLTAGLDDEDQEMEEIAQINFEPEILNRIQGERGSNNSERTERSRRTVGRRNPSNRNGDRRRRQQNNSTILREARALGAALGRQTGSRIRTRRANRENQDQSSVPQQSDEIANASTQESVEPSTSSNVEPSNNQDNKDDEQSNSSWEDVSEEETVSADNSMINDNPTDDNVGKESTND